MEGTVAAAGLDELTDNVHPVAGAGWEKVTRTLSVFPATSLEASPERTDLIKPVVVVPPPPPLPPPLPPLPLPEDSALIGEFLKSLISFCF